MIKYVFFLVAVLGLAELYVSRFWIFNLWGREGLFGIEALGPNGGLLARWLRGTMMAPFSLLLWMVGVFVVLTWMQRLQDWR